jgi:hypothetical protein
MSGILGLPTPGVEVRAACLCAFTCAAKAQPIGLRHGGCTTPIPRRPPMRQKIALAAASLAATATLTIALAAAGLAPAAKVIPASAEPATTTVTARPSPRVQIDTVYVAPAPTQQTITIVQPAPGGEPGESGEGTGGDD